MLYNIFLLIYFIQSSLYLLVSYPYVSPHPSFSLLVTTSLFLMSVFYKCFDCHFFFESIFWLLLLMKVNSLQGLSSVLEDIHMSLWGVGCLSPVQCIITAHYPTGNHFDTTLKSKGQFICEDIALSQFLPSWFWHYL